MTTPIVKYLLVIFFCSLTWSAYAKNNKDQSIDIPVKKIIWTGCGITKKAFMFEIAKAYKKKYGVTIELRGGGATKGIRSTKAGTSHIGGTCRIPMQTREESSELFKMILVAWDALVVIVNKESPISGIKKNELVDVLNGNIKYWNELSDWQGKSSPKQAIHLYTRRSKISGVGYTLRRILFNDNEKELTSYKYFPSSGPLEKAVEKETGSFAITGISSARKRHVKVLKLDGVTPDYEAIKSGSYTMYRPLYLTYISLFKLPKNEKKEVKRFLKFIQSKEAAKIIKENGVVPFKEGFHLVTQRKDIFGI